MDNLFKPENYDKLKAYFRNNPEMEAELYRVIKVDGGFKKGKVPYADCTNEPLWRTITSQQATCNRPKENK